MITCNLTKLETTLDQVRKTKTALRAADAALIATALVNTGRYAVAVIDDREYVWVEDTDALAKALVGVVETVRKNMEGQTKKTAKAAAEDERFEIRIQLRPNLTAGEAVLGKRDDLKVILSDLMQEGVEYGITQSTDVGWQWTLERVNWATIWESVYGTTNTMGNTGIEEDDKSIKEIARKVVIRSEFIGGATSVELGGSATKRKARSPKSE